MVYLFHGDNIFASRTSANDFLTQYPQHEILRCDRDTDPETISLFLAGQSLFSVNKVLFISNFFSFPHPSQDKLIKSISSNPDIPVLIWQDKKLTLVQIKLFSQACPATAGAKVQHFPLDNLIFQCLNAIKPKNLANFLRLYRQLDLDSYYDLFLYLAKAQLRRQLSSYSHFNPKLLKQSYLRLIELDFYNKTGQLPLPKHIALEHIISFLIKQAWFNLAHLLALLPIDC